jgi:tryptophan-rich sensory protein
MLNDNLNKMDTLAKTEKFRVLPLLASLGITLVIGFVASLVTRPQIAGWYNLLRKPAFNPPSWLFAPVWTAIYILIAIAAYMVWQRRDGSTNYATAKAVYIIQLALNFSWSIVFFGFHGIAAALLVIILLWITIVLNIRWFGKFSKPASWLLLPYFLWVSFATILNLSIFFLNR